MAKVTVFLDCPSIAHYYSGDEDIPGVFVGTFEEDRKKIIDKLHAYIKQLESVTYSDWKKNHGVL